MLCDDEDVVHAHEAFVREVQVSQHLEGELVPACAEYQMPEGVQRYDAMSDGVMFRFP